MNTIDKCDLCGKVRPTNESWSTDHATAGCSGFNFMWCPNCENDDIATGKIMSETISNWIKYCREQQVDRLNKGGNKS